MLDGRLGDDSSKIGGHGIGFNSVYHFTDVPSVVSGDHIVFFDPRREYLPNRRGQAPQGGHRYNFVKMKKDVRSGQFEPYKGLFGCDMQSHFKGTIFRIPLRTLDMQGSSHVKIVGRVWTPDQIHTMFRSWEAQSKVGLLFLDKINVIEIDDDVYFKWSATKVVANVRLQLGDTLNEQQQQHGPAASTRIVDIRISGSVEYVKWLVHTEHDFPQIAPRDVRELGKKNHWNADRGIAIPLNFNYKARSFNGLIFTHLPTPILTGLPFHIHGVFALTTDRKGLAGGSGKFDSKFVWNQFMMETALPRTAANAFTKLLQYMFRPETQGGPKSWEIGQTIEQYFRFWPVKPKTDGSQGQNTVNAFFKNFIRISHKKPIFPCRFALQTPPVVGLKGQDVVFTGSILNDTIGNLGQIIRGRLQSIGTGVCDCPGYMQAQIEAQWKSSTGMAALTYRRVNSSLIRRLIRHDNTFLPSLRRDDEKRWVLGVILGKAFDADAFAAEEPLAGLAIIPLMNGEWKELRIQGSSTRNYYVAETEIRELIKGEDVLVDESLFKAVKDQKLGGKTAPDLESILHRLVQGATYNLKEMPPEVLATRICTENPLGIPIELRTKIWRHLNTYTDLSPFYDVPILKTLDGRILPLRSAREGLEISSVRDVRLRQSVREIARLLMDLGVLVFDATQNHSHPFLASSVPRAERTVVLGIIARYCGDSWPVGRVLTEDEATILRDLITSSGAEIQPFVANLGDLKIWKSWAPSSNRNSPLICARGSYFLDCHYRFDWSTFGDNSVIIRHPNNNHLSAMGARSLTLIEVLMERILPRLQDGTQAFTSAIISEYIEIFKEIISLALRTGHQWNLRAQSLLKNERFILARDNTLRNSATLFNPQDQLCTAIFGEVPYMFPHPSVWNQIWPNRRHLFSFQDSENPDVVQECADRVLEMTQGQTQLSPEVVHTRAAIMVDFIYWNDDQINWLDPRWKIVPAETTTTSPYNDCAPDLPRYQSFGELMDPIWHDVVWTQCAFFPETLNPPQQFKNRFPTVGRPNLSIVVDHLNALVRDLAPRWKSIDRQMALKSVLFAVYRFLDDAAVSDSTVERLLKTRVQVPFLLNGDDADSSDPESWFRPDQLMLDIDNDIGQFHTVSNKLRRYRRLLVAVGVMEMKEVIGMVDVPNGRRAGEIESMFRNSFEAQDQHKGLLDVRYKFANGRQIMAHRDWLAFTNEYFDRRFTGVWAEYLTRDPSDPHVAIIDLSTQDETYETFYGLVYYLYTDRLIPTNGPLLLPSEVVSTPGATSATHFDELGDRVQYLMDLLRLSHEYDIIRLKKLIAHEIVVHKKVTHGNVFDVRGYALQTESTDVQEHCEAYIEQNGSSIRTYLNGEIEEQRKLLDQLTGDDDGARRAEIKSLISELENNLVVLDTFARQ